MAASGVAWKDSTTGSITTIGVEEVEKVMAVPSGKAYQLRLWLNNESVQRFDGLTGEQVEEIEHFVLGHFSGIPWERREKSLKGHTWGKLVLDHEEQARMVEFQVSSKMAFDLPLAELSSVTVPTRHELSIEVNPSEDRKADSLIEARWFIPPTIKEAPDAGEAVSMEAEEEIDEASKLSLLLKRHLEKYSSTSTATEIIAAVPETAFVVPRGRYQLDMGPASFRMHGKSYDYRIPYSSILKLIMVPKPDDVHIQLVIALDPPIKQGQTRYPFLICQFDKDEQLELDLQNISPADLQSRYEGRLKEHQEGACFEVVSNLFRCLAGHKIIVPGAFQSAANQASLKCSIKAAEGHLYPLERNLLFLPKPCLLISHPEIGNVEFSRIGSGLGNPRSFDMKISLKSGQDHTISNLSKEEYQGLEDYLRSKQISITRVEEDSLGKKRISQVEQMEDSSEDEDYADEGSDEGSEEEDEEYDGSDDEGSDDEVSEESEGDGSEEGSEMEE